MKQSHPMEPNVAEAFRRLERKLNTLISLAFVSLAQGAVEMAGIQDLFDAVESETSVDESILTLVDQLVALVKSAGVDPIKLDAALATVAANKQKIVDKVNANTPSTP